MVLIGNTDIQHLVRWYICDNPDIRKLILSTLLLGGASGERQDHAAVGQVGTEQGQLPQDARVHGKRAGTHAREQVGTNFTVIARLRDSARVSS